KVTGGIHAAVSRGQFGPAALARPESSRFRFRRVPEKQAVPAHRRFHAAYGPAIDAGGLDSDVKSAVKPTVPRQHRPITLIRIQRHGNTLAEKSRVRSPFSEVEF